MCDELEHGPSGNWSAAAAALLIEAAVVLDDAGVAVVGENKLAPRSGQAIVLGVGSAYLGPVDRYLGLAAGLRDREAGITLLSQARDQADLTGATHWRDRAVVDLGRFG